MDESCFFFLLRKGVVEERWRTEREGRAKSNKKCNATATAKKGGKLCQTPKLVKCGVGAVISVEMKQLAPSRHRPVARRWRRKGGRKKAQTASISYPLMDVVVLCGEKCFFFCFASVLPSRLVFNVMLTVVVFEITSNVFFKQKKKNKSVSECRRVGCNALPVRQQLSTFSCQEKRYKPNVRVGFGCWKKEGKESKKKKDPILKEWKGQSDCC